jgi:serine/threonine protein kinase
MRRCADLWKSLSPAAQAVFRRRSEEEWMAQQRDLNVQGVSVRRRPKTARDAVDPDNDNNAKKKPAAAAEAAEGSAVEHAVVVDRVGEYRLERAADLGRGAYGTVLLGYSSNGTKVAIKAFRAGGCRREVEVYRHLQDTLTAAEHMWFPLLLGADLEGRPCPWAALEYSGPSLHQAIENSGGLSDQLVWRVGAQLREALRVLHNKAKLLHLDLKPRNILFEEVRGRVVVVDFGLSEAQDSTAIPTFVGYATAGYRAPEIWDIEGMALRKALSCAVDYFSYGCVLHECITGDKLLKPLMPLSSSQATDEAQNAAYRKAILAWSRVWVYLSSHSAASSSEAPKWPNRQSSEYFEAVRFRARVAKLGKHHDLVLRACCPDVRRRSINLPQSW